MHELSIDNHAVTISWLHYLTFCNVYLHNKEKLRFTQAVRVECPSISLPALRYSFLPMIGCLCRTASPLSFSPAS